MTTLPMIRSAHALRQGSTLQVKVLSSTFCEAAGARLGEGGIVVFSSLVAGGRERAAAASCHTLSHFNRAEHELMPCLRESCCVVKTKLCNRKSRRCQQQEQLHRRQLRRPLAPCCGGLGSHTWTTSTRCRPFYCRALASCNSLAQKRRKGPLHSYCAVDTAAWDEKRINIKSIKESSPQFYTRPCSLHHVLNIFLRLNKYFFW